MHLECISSYYQAHNIDGGDVFVECLRSVNGCTIAALPHRADADLWTGLDLSLTSTSKVYSLLFNCLYLSTEKGLC